MQIIVLRAQSHARSITLTGWHLWLAILGLCAAIITAVALLYYLTLRYASVIELPIARELMEVSSSKEMAERDKYIKENLAAMAVRLGEMQAQLLRLDALGERVQGLAGIKPEEFNFKQKPGRGGGLDQPSSASGQVPDMLEFQKVLDMMAKDVERRADHMNYIESTLMADKIKSKLLPTVQPVNVAYNASSFGWRLDPFTGGSAFHEGIDFAAPSGTPIVAAAGGVVVAAEYHPQYGNMLEIDHGNEIVTRYAHASKILVKIGDIVRRGQHVANVGSTGRSTGPHLHFEVLVKGVPQNPNKFLHAGAAQARMAAGGKF